MLHLPHIGGPSTRGTSEAFHDALARGDLARAHRDWPVAAACYAEALRIDGSDSALWVQYGHALKESAALIPAIEAYRTASARKPDCADAWLHFAHALKRAGFLSEAETAFAETLRLRECAAVRGELRALGVDDATLDKIRPVPGATLAIDVTDLVQHVRHSRILTGIQRVQVDLVEGLAERGPERPTLVAFDAEAERWLLIPIEILRRISRLAARSGTIADPDWQGLVAAIDASLHAPSPAVFARGATLLNLGTSWWLRNYFLAVRRLKERFAIRYVPFVHDLIPLVAGEHCTPVLRRDFLLWLAGVFDHADGFVVNSQATKRDLLATAAELGRTVRVGDPVRLDGIPRRAGRRGDGTSRANPFVLFVSTIESRKNHLMAFDAWLALVRERGEAAVPDLVCVGSKGWMVEAALARLSASPALSRKIHILSDIGDDTLAQLYADCLFTLYPSAYEGWGLPVTEALANGKVPLVAQATSLPEAGGSFAVYFDPHSARDFEAKLRRLLDDQSFRQAAERRIREGFTARPWRDVAGDLLDALSPVQALDAGPFTLACGAYHHFGSREEPVWPPDPSSGERFRTGEGWGVPGPLGCLAGPSAGLAFRVDESRIAGADLFVCLLLAGAGGAVLRRIRVRADNDGSVHIALNSLVEPGGATLLGFSCVRCDDRTAVAALIEAASFGELGPLGAVSC